MSEMVDRVARAQFEALADDPVHQRAMLVIFGRTNVAWSDLPDCLKATRLKTARAAIAALREPTDAMLLAGADVPSGGPHGEIVGDGISGPVWARMIDEALKP